MKLDWFVARSAFRENDHEAVIALVERQFNVEIDRQREIKLLPHGWEEVAVCVGYDLATYKVSQSGWVTWHWNTWHWNTSTQLLDHTIYKKQIIIYGPTK